MDKQHFRQRITYRIIVNLAQDSFRYMKVITKNSTAILVFARSSEEELRHKKIRRGKSLFDALTGHVLTEVKKTQLPYFHINETQQDGVSFGVRFSNAIQMVFDKGYNRIITIGNDSPHLTSSHIEEAILALQNEDLVIGPSSDGGFYLMGLHRNDFNKANFEKLSWQTSSIRKEVIDMVLPKEKKVFALNQLSDIDTFFDVKAMAKSTLRSSRRVLKAIELILFEHKRNDIPISLCLKVVNYSIPFNKGSPIPSLF